MEGPILTATDFSARADRAIDRAIMLAQQMGQKVILAHALDRKEAAETDEKSLERRMRGVLPEGIPGSVTVEFAHVEGSAPAALAQLAGMHKAGLVVMGPARHNSLRDYLLGTAVDYTLRHVDQPVLLVKQRPHHPYSRIVLATDYAKPSVQALMLALAEFPDAEVHIVHGCHMPFQGLDNAVYSYEEVLSACRTGMQRFLETLPIEPSDRERITTHVAMGTPYEIVRNVSRVVDANLLVVGSHGESGFRHATIGSIANVLLTSSAIDTLVVKTPD